MRSILVLLAILFAVTAVASAGTADAAPSLAAQQGSWICLPDEPSAPQVLVDFEENVYRRCDQNTCVTYDIVAVRQDDDATEVAFAPDAHLRADDGGHRYAEFITSGGATTTSTGSCTFRGSEPAPDAFEKERMRQRG